MKILLSCILLTCVGILIMLCDIRVKLEDRDLYKQVTEVHHHYEYAVESYGPVRLNDKLVDFTVKR